MAFNLGQPRGAECGQDSFGGTQASMLSKPAPQRLVIFLGGNESVGTVSRRAYNFYGHRQKRFVGDFKQA